MSSVRNNLKAFDVRWIQTPFDDASFELLQNTE